MAVPRRNERKVELAEVGAPLSDIVERAVVAGERVVIQKDGVRLAVIVPSREAEALDRRAVLEAGRAAVERMRAAFAGVPQEEIEREIARAVAEARAEARLASDPDVR